MSRCFCPPSILGVAGIANLEGEVFGPILHFATYKAGDEAAVVNAINKSGYGLTFGMHSRIDTNIEAVSEAINVGNVYINRNQIGAVVGSQPFGGHGLSGTGPKAGGPLYLNTFLKKTEWKHNLKTATFDCPGPSGEHNKYILTAKNGKVLVLHKDARIRKELARIAESFGNTVKMAETLNEELADVDVVMTHVEKSHDAGVLRKALCKASPRVIPLITDEGGYAWLRSEKHICRDVTASGGNIDLLMK